MSMTIKLYPFISSVFNLFYFLFNNSYISLIFLFSYRYIFNYISYLLLSITSNLV